MESCINENKGFFKQNIISHITYVPFSEPTVKEILNTSVWAEVRDIKIFKTEKGLSYKGDNLSGCKIMANILLEGKITYVGNGMENNVHGIKFSTTKSMYIILPEKISNKNIYNLYRENRIVLSAYIEGSYSRIINSNNIYTSMVIFLDANMCI